jgi:hypothetical protein
MLTVKYKVTGTRQPNFSAEGTVKELLSWTAYFPAGKDIPPRSVMNDVFRTGHRDNGFNGDVYWEPFELGPEEYEELVAELLADKEKGYTILETPAWVETELDWMAYTQWYYYGVPLQEYRQILYDYHDLIDAQNKAIAEGDESLAFTLKLKLGEAAMNMANFLSKYHRG